MCMSNAGVSLRVIQKISGHHSMAELQKYLAVTEEPMEGAIACFRFSGLLRLESV